MIKTRVAINKTAMARARVKIITGKTKVRTAMARAKDRIITGKTKVRTAMARAKDRTIATLGKGLEVSNTRVIMTTLTKTI